MKLDSTKAAPKHRWMYLQLLVTVMTLCFSTSASAQENATPAGVEVWNTKPVAEEVDLPDGNPQPLQPMTIVGTRNGCFSGKIVLTSRREP